jgi:carboxymethylenebutenolidase
MTITTEEITLGVSGSSMQAYVARPESGKAPALIIFQEAFGVNDHIKDVARQLAQQGYVTIAPELFHRTAPGGFTAAYEDFEAIRQHIQATNAETIGDDARACYDWLTNDRQVDKTFIGSIGFCLGGRSAVIANARLPLQAAVSFYGGVPPDVAEIAREQHGPVLFFWGGLDKHLGPEQRNAVTGAMAQAGKLYINVEISDADHGFFCDARAAYNPNAARQAWALTLSFLATYLK